jgi:hypothetical protein
MASADGGKGSRPESASQTIVSMSLRLAIPWRVGLHLCPPPLYQPMTMLRMRSLCEKEKSLNSRCSYRKLSHCKGSVQKWSADAGEFKLLKRVERCRSPRLSHTTDPKIL